MKTLLQKHALLLTIVLLLFPINMTQAQKIIEIAVWPNGAPCSNGMNEKEITGDHGHIFHISQASLTLYLPDKCNGKAIISCPGGGYSFVSSLHEGHNFSQWLNEQGIAYAVLKYRLPNGNYQVPVDDAQQAIRILREHAQEWNIDKIGVMGFSAGGHLATTVATHFDQSTRPDFQVLFYPVVSLQNGITHNGTRDAFLGKNRTEDLVSTYSNELQVTQQTPPAFIVHCSDDPAVPVANSLLYYKALINHKISAELHCYPHGGHGWGFKDSFPYKQEWMTELSRWLRNL